MYTVPADQPPPVDSPASGPYATGPRHQRDRPLERFSSHLPRRRGGRGGTGRPGRNGRATRHNQQHLEGEQPHGHATHPPPEERNEQGATGAGDWSPAAGPRNQPRPRGYGTRRWLPAPLRTSSPQHGPRGYETSRWYPPPEAAPQQPSAHARTHHQTNQPPEKRTGTTRAQPPNFHTPHQRNPRHPSHRPRASSAPPTRTLQPPEENKRTRHHARPPHGNDEQPPETAEPQTKLQNPHQRNNAHRQNRPPKRQHARTPKPPESTATRRPTPTREEANQPHQKNKPPERTDPNPTTRWNRRRSRSEPPTLEQEVKKELRALHDARAPDRGEMTPNDTEHRIHPWIEQPLAFTQRTP